MQKSTFHAMVITSLLCQLQNTISFLLNGFSDKKSSDLTRILWATACLGLVSQSSSYAATRTYVTEGFERSHRVGFGPTWPSSITPESYTAGSASYLLIVDGVENTAGTGQALKLRQYDSSTLRYTHDFTENSQFQISALRFSFDFAYVEGLPAGELVVCGAEHGSTLSGNDRKYFAASLTGDGFFHNLDVSSGSHHLDVYVNDYETAFTYTDPTGNQVSLAANTADWYINGTFVLNNTLRIDKVGGSIENFGRVGFRANGAGSCYIVDNIEIEDLDAAVLPINRQESALAKVDIDGKLAYGYYANVGQENDERNLLPDFSRCGYKAGGFPIPFVPAAITLTPSSDGDDTDEIQAAIDQLAALPLGTDGFRGALLLKAGTYHVTSELFIEADGIVLRGEGQGVNGTVLVFTANYEMECLKIAGNDFYVEDANTLTQITDSVVSVGAVSFNVADASAYQVGDKILIYNRYNQAWIDAIYQDDPIDPNVDPIENPPYGWTSAEYSLIDNPNSIAAIVGNTIYLDTPIVNGIETQYGGGEIVKYTHDAISNVGIEAIRMEATFPEPLTNNFPRSAILVRNTNDFWIRQVTGQYFRRSLVDLGKGAHFGTIEDCAMIDYMSVGKSRYGFAIDDANHNLFQRCYARDGRHDFQVGSKCPGPNAFVDCGAEMAIADIGPHSRWSMGFLWDNVKGQRIQVPNRRDTGSGHGWSGVQHVLWNCESTVMMCDAPIGSQNLSIGCVTAQIEGKVLESEFGLWENLNEPVTPRSLYYKQLEDRLSEEAVANVIIPAQAAGTIWDSLFAWGGEGFYGEALALWEIENSEANTYRVDLLGVLRNLQMLDAGITVTWSNLSGPAPVTILDPVTLPASASHLKKTVEFTQAGSYQFELMVSAPGFPTLSRTIDITVAQEPFNGTAAPLPGTIQAEDFDFGGDGISFSDATPGNALGGYRSGDIDIESTTDVEGGGYSVASVADGEWMEYAVNAIGSTYDIKGRFTTKKSNRTLTLKLGDGPDGDNYVTLGTIDVPQTGSNHAYQTVTLNNIVIPDSANKVLRLECGGSGFKINWLDFQIARRLNVKIEAEVYEVDNAGQTPDIDEGIRGVYGISTASSNAKLGNARNGRWVKYPNFDFEAGASTVDIFADAKNGAALIEFRLGSPTGTLIASGSLPQAGSNNFQLTTLSVSGASGVQDLYLVAPSNDFSVDWFEFK